MLTRNPYGENKKAFRSVQQHGNFMEMRIFNMRMGILICQNHSHLTYDKF
jgi:hypothetical protein